MAEWFQKGVWRSLFRVAGRLLPMRGMQLLAHPVSYLLSFAGIRQNVAEQNLRRAFPELQKKEVRRLARAAFRNLVIVYLEIPALRYLSQKGLKKFLAVENLDLLRSIDKRGALLLSGHVGNWELLALGAAVQAERSFAVVVKGQKDFGELDLTRRSHGNTTIPGHLAALRVSRILAEGGVAAMLADQSARREDHVVDLFGIPTHAFSAPARLALRYRPRVIVGFAVRTAGGSYHALLQELPYDDLPDSDEGVTAFTTRYMKMLEDVVRRHPEQWVWHHRRWKHTPGVTYTK